MSRNSGNSGCRPRPTTCPAGRPPASANAAGREAAGQAARRSRRAPGLAGGPGRHEGLVPGGPCACGRDLADADDLGVSASRQLIETPVVTAKVTQYDSHAVACACGRVHAAAPPAGAGQAGTVT